MIPNPPPSLTSPPWSERTKRTVALITLGLLFLLFLQLLQAWSVVFVALILSYLLNPLANLIEEQGLYFIRYPELRRSLAVLLTFIVVIVIIVFIVLLIIPPVTSQMREFAENVPELLESAEKDLESSLSRPIKIGNQTIIPWEEVSRLMEGEGDTGENIDVAATIQQAATTLSTPIFSVATIAFSVIFNFLFVFVMMFYFMKDGSKFIYQVETVIPVEYQGDIRRLIYELGSIWNAYLRGQLLLGLAVGSVTGLGATILGLPQPLVLGLLAGLLEFIPNIGPFASSVPAILFALVSPSTTIPGLEGLPYALIVAVMYIFIQQAESLFLVPRVMGRTLDLHPLMILIAVLSGAAIAGLLGIILASPVVATMRLLLMYIWGKLMDIDPFVQKDRGEMKVKMMHDPALVGATPPALAESFIPPQRGEIVE